MTDPVEDELDLLEPAPNDSIIGMVVVCAVAFLLIAAVGALAISTAVDAQNTADANAAEIAERKQADRKACADENAARDKQRDALLEIDSILAGAGIDSTRNQRIIELVTEGWSVIDCAAVAPLE